VVVAADGAVVVDIVVWQVELQVYQLMAAVIQQWEYVVALKPGQPTLSFKK
jgi:hypothetical protein